MASTLACIEGGGMTYRQISWAITGTLFVATLGIGAASYALDLGAVMHDLHCLEHGSRVTSAPARA